ncbi:hypothetical protein F5888DRAFT_2735 [Russula emetica]|nr:hypothetical protein F5888DRAFT_2735 [Russula emetica]
MAKPTLDSLRPAASSSTSTRRPNPSPSVSSYPLNRSSRSRPTRSRILPLLAAISAAPLSIHAYPLDPTQTSLPFLYPSFLHQPTPFVKRSDTSSTLNAPTPTGSSPAPSLACKYDRGELPDKYVVGGDGLWHKTIWSLYGSANSANCPILCSPTANNDLSDTQGSQASSPSSFDDFDFSSLPTGWTSFGIDASSHRGTIVVLALSVALALVIIVFMFACVFWRRKHIRKRDPEKRRRKYSGTADDDSSRSIREAKATKKKWSKAAFRWRENLRVSAHRRRTNRALAPAASCSTHAKEEGIDAGSSLSYFRPSSPTLSERSVTPTPSDIRSSSTASIHSSHPRIQTPRVLTFTDLDPPPLSPPPAQPPAYDPPPSSPESHVSPENTYPDSSLAGTSKAPLPSHTQSQPRGDDDGHLNSLSGHVATDDKAILSLRAAMASAPPVSNSNLPQSASVPSMEDEDTFEWPSESWPPSPSPDDYGYEPHPPYSPPTSMLPPPPSKGKQRFDYSHDLDISVNLDSATVEPQLGPSAPPFEECEAVPSAPPLTLTRMFLRRLWTRKIFPDHH